MSQRIFRNNAAYHSYVEGDDVELAKSSRSIACFEYIQNVYFSPYMICLKRKSQVVKSFVGRYTYIYADHACEHARMMGPICLLIGFPYKKVPPSCLSTGTKMICITSQNTVVPYPLVID